MHQSVHKTRFGRCEVRERKDFFKKDVSHPNVMRDPPF